MQIVCKGRNNYETFTLEINGDGGLTFLLRDVNDLEEEQGLSNEDRRLPINEWVHIAGTYDGYCPTSYVNGRVDRQDPNRRFKLFVDADDGMGIGERPGDLGDEGDWDPFIGTIDDVRIYDYGLSGAEICHIASDGDGVVELVNNANLFTNEPSGTKQAVNLKDFAVLMDEWLAKEQPLLWPE
jgi:hypothetical protein